MAHGPRPESRRTPTPEEIAAITANFDDLHFPPGMGLAPDGTELEESLPKPPAKGFDRTFIGLLLLILLLIIALVWMLSKKGVATG